MGVNIFKLEMWNHYFCISHSQYKKFDPISTF